MVAPTRVRAYTGNRVKPGATGTGACFSYPFLSFGVSVMRGSMISGSTEYEFCRGDHWSPALCNRNFWLAFVAFLTERNGRPMVAPTGAGRLGESGRTGGNRDGRPMVAPTGAERSGKSRWHRSNREGRSGGMGKTGDMAAAVMWVLVKGRTEDVENVTVFALFAKAGCFLGRKRVQYKRIVAKRARGRSDEWKRGI